MLYFDGDYTVVRLLDVMCTTISYHMSTHSCCVIAQLRLLLTVWFSISAVFDCLRRRTEQEMINKQMMQTQSKAVQVYTHSCCLYDKCHKL
jgi:hypothetical protein